MKKFSNFICKNKLLIIIIAIILMFMSFIGIYFTKVNYDILVYLPDDIETIKGQNILTEEFNMGGYSIATIENMSPKNILSLEKKIGEVDGVNKVISIYDAIGTNIPIEMIPNEISDKLYKDNTDIMFIVFDESTSNEKTINAVDKIRALTDNQIKQGGMSSLVLDTMKLSEKEIVIYIIIAILLCIIVLELSLDSYIVPFLLLANIGFAIIFNLGTNILLGQISYITKALVAVLQLGVTTDFSIFLYHSYEKNKDKYKIKEKAMSEAIKDTFISVTGSSFTTIVGFLALCAMKLTLGTDLGIVMAKGVLLGVITVITLFPSLILFFDKLIEKTRHKSLIPNFSKFNSFIIRHYKSIFVIFLILLIPSYLANKKIEVYYKLDSSLPDTLESVSTNKILEDKFNIVSPEIVLIDKNLKDDSVIDMIDEIKSLDGIDFAISIRNLKSYGISENIFSSELKEKFETDKYEMILINSQYDIATTELNNQTAKLNKIVKSYDKGAIVAGEGPLMKDLVETYDTDYNHVNLLSIGCIFIVLLLVLKSFSLPLLLIISIEMAIFLNISVSYFNGTVLPFIAPITLGTIQLGATIDYAILVTTNYLDKRKSGMNKEEAILETMNYSVPSIIISGLCFFAATYGVGIYSDIEMIGSICSLISRGALISVVIVITVLPSILLVFDELILKTNFNNRKVKVKMKKNKNSLKISLIIMGTLLMTFPANALALTKNETVYSKLDYNGKQENIIINENLINNDKLETIEDYSKLKQIINISNDNIYTSDNNKLTWKTKGKDVLYQGTTDKELPIKLDVTYKLNGKEYTANEMLGKKGKVTITLKYTNKDKHGDIYTPFVITFGTVVTGNNNNDIEVTNGKIINNGENYLIAALAAPGLYESLGLEEIKNLDTITITYNTTKFELSSMYSVVTPKIIDSSDLKVLYKLDGIYSKVDELQESINIIENGAQKTYAGSTELKNKLYDAISNIDMNSDALTNEQLDSIKNESINSIQSLFTDEYKNQISSEALNNLKENETYKSFVNGIDLLEKNGITSSLVNVCSSNTISTTYESICINNKENIQKYSTLINMKNLMEETTKTATINTAYKTAISTAQNLSYDLSKKVSNQVKNAILSTVKQSYNTIYDNVDILNNGIEELSDGISKYNNEGIKSITTLVNTDIKTTHNKIKELVKLSENYQNFDNNNSNIQGSTKFILTIDSLKEPKKEIKKEKVVKKSLWERIKNLFE